MSTSLFTYLLQLGDNPLILGQRLSEWCGHGPILETDMAMTNIALDLLGQTRSYFQYAAEVSGDGRNEDQLAFLRSEREYRNLLLVEQPNGDFAMTMLRQFFFDAYHQLFLHKLSLNSDGQLAAIAAKSLKEVTYHLRFSGEWVIRLGDGTTESHRRAQDAVDELWMYTGEMFEPSPVEAEMAAAGIGVDVTALAKPYRERVEQVLREATLAIPEEEPFQTGGKTGVHTEHLGHILAEMQQLQRAHPGAEW
jgi:ring-1,2-phenylacetyl-CoA epoxidase subunit PaaC